MPYIKLSVSKKVAPETEQVLVDCLGEALSKIPGKDPQWTMVEFNDGLKLYFGGQKQDDMVFAEVMYCGHFGLELKQAFTRAACTSIHEVLGTPIDRICLNIAEFDGWGAVGDYREIPPAAE